VAANSGRARSRRREWDAASFNPAERGAQLRVGAPDSVTTISPVFPVADDSGKKAGRGGLPVRALRWLALLVVLAVALPLLAYAISSQNEGRPTATVRIHLLSGTTDPFAFPTAPAATVLNAEAVLTRSTKVLEGACRRFPQPPPNASALKACGAALGKDVFVSTESTTGYLRLQVRGSSRQVASTHAEAMTASLLATSAAYAQDKLVAAFARVRLAASSQARNSALSALVRVTRGLVLQTDIRTATAVSGSPLVPTLVAAVLALLAAIALTRPWRGAKPTMDEQESQLTDRELTEALPR
jgi:hypothetical protein